LLRVASTQACGNHSQHENPSLDEESEEVVHGTVVLRGTAHQQYTENRSHDGLTYTQRLGADAVGSLDSDHGVLWQSEIAEKWMASITGAIGLVIIWLLAIQPPKRRSRSMSDLAESVNAQELKPLVYHENLRDFLKQEEPEVWHWYASHKVRDEQAEAIRFELLKSTYRLEREAHTGLYLAAEEVAGKLGLNVSLTIYQAHNPQGLNASLAYVPGEAHIVLHGPVATKLTDAELRALLAHELSHFLMWRAWDGEFMIAEQILAALTHDPLADTPHFASARLVSLYNEVFCDRGSLLVAGDPLVVISTLLKVETQLDEVDPESYLRQAEEVFGHAGTKTEGLSHPEAFIRARAVKLWADRDPAADRKIEEMLEGRLVLGNLDLLAQRKAAGLTRRLLDVLLSRRWMQTESVLAHARLFFDDYLPPQDLLEDAALAVDLCTDDRPMQDYYCYVLLDFVTADRDLEELPLAAALALAEKLGLKDRFGEIAKRELRLRKKQWESIDQEKAALLAKASQEAGSP
jgi:Zn-dependent protease with chaperone function